MPLPTDLTTAIARLRNGAARQAQSVQTPGLPTRAWTLFLSIPVSGGEHVQLPQVLRRLTDNRDASNALYVTALRAGADPADPAGALGVLGAAKAAVDYLACVERAAQAAAAGRVRCRVWAAGRRAGLAADRGGYDAVRRHLDAMLEAAAPPEPEEDP